MGRYRQYSFDLDAPQKGQDKILTISAQKFVRPKEFLSVVNQYGKPKLHALVDTETYQEERTILVLGTGQSAPDDLIDRLIKIGTLNFGDGQYGYHYYFVEDEESDIVYKRIECVKRDDVDDDEFESFENDIAEFVLENRDNLVLIRDDNEDGDRIVIGLKNQESKFEKTEQFKDFVHNIMENDVVDVSIKKV